jgi:hypothetical protein
MRFISTRRHGALLHAETIRFRHTSARAISIFVFIGEMTMFVGRFWHITQARVLGRRTLIISRLIPKSP